MSEYTGTVLVTGGSSGIGYEAALEIAKQQPTLRIIIAARSNAVNADEKINQITGNNSVVFQRLDLSSLASVRAYATALIAENRLPLRALVLNAGLQFPGGVQYTADGFEATFGVNHVGHALLFHLLAPHLADGARVVVTASGTHDPAQKTGIPDAYYDNAEELAHPTEETSKNAGRQRYSTSKLCNVMWTYAVDRRLAAARGTGKGKGITVTAFDPGFVPATGLVRDAGWLPRFIVSTILPNILPLLRRFVIENVHTPQESGFALARLAVGGDVEGVSGKYYEGLKIIESSPASKRVEKQEDLWTWTVKAIAKDEDERRRFEMTAST